MKKLFKRTVEVSTINGYGYGKHVKPFAVPSWNRTQEAVEADILRLVESQILGMKVDRIVPLNSHNGTRRLVMIGKPTPYGMERMGSLEIVYDMPREVESP